MDVSGLFIRILFLLLPGVLASAFYRKLKGRTTRKDWEDYIEIIIFSLFSYIFYALILSVINYFRVKNGYSEIPFTAFNAFFDEKVTISWQELLYASIVGIIISFASAYSYKKRLINRLGHFFKITNHAGEEDIWYFFHNLPDVEWVFVRDHKADVTYYGWVSHYSDPYKEREMLLRDVDVYVNSTGVFLYKRDAIYVSRKQEDLTIEIASNSDNIIEGENNGRNQDTVS